ncbi:MAG TPA: cytochrome c [Vicinamibacterales bacterium]|nr:cytochrome c [Vicinamibacterales bacterium]
MTRTGLLLAAATIGLAVTIACTSEDESREHDRRRAKKPVATAAMLEKGRSTYMTTCAPCHGESGKGDGPASKIFKPPPRDHTDAAYMDAISDEELGKTIQMGGVMKGKPLMPSNPQIRDAELQALIAYVRSLARRSN